MNLVERGKRILLTPRAEWEVIDAEATTPQALYTGYVMPLAAIGPVALVIRLSLFGLRVPFGGAVYRVPIGSLGTSTVVRYVLTLVGVYVLALIIDGLASTFGGTPNRIQALKVAAYSSTAAWVAGIFAIVPALSLLGILGLYSLYLLYLGLPILMKAPSDKGLAYTAVVIVAAIVLFFVIGIVVGRFIAYPVG
jgi:Yip1 domain